MDQKNLTKPKIKGFSTVTQMARTLGHGLVDALFPLKCRNCGEFFLRNKGGAGQRRKVEDCFSFSHLFAQHLCPECRLDFTPLSSPLCRCCGMMFESRQGNDRLCGRCLESPPHFYMARSAGLYEGSLRRLVHGLKYRHKQGLAKPLGRLLGRAFEQYWPKRKVDLMGPVPLHPSRMRQRGFNQALLPLIQWRKQNRENSNIPQLVMEILVRSRATAPQQGLNRKKRKTNIKGAFSAKNPAQIKGRSILLVDDVLTTGATVDECAKALLKGGAARVDVLTIARVM